MLARHAQSTLSLDQLHSPRVEQAILLLLLLLLNYVRCAMAVVVAEYPATLWRTPCVATAAAHPLRLWLLVWQRPHTGIVLTLLHTGIVLTSPHTGIVLTSPHTHLHWRCMSASGAISAHTHHDITAHYLRQHYS